MHLATTVALSGVLAASSVAAIGSPHDFLARGLNSHKDLARDIRDSLKRAIPPTLAGKKLKKKRDAANPNLKKRCRVRPTGQLNASTAPATQTSPATSTSSSAASSDQTGTPDNVSTGNSPWKLRVAHQGNSFFDKWDFWSYSDPTHGIVDFLDSGSAWNSGLISINDKGNAVMKVETTDRVSGNRKSIRLHDQAVFNGGLLLMDAVHMPVGCGTWPAFWSNGPNWPYGGEIDILEGVHNGPTNQVSIHTGSGCSISQDVSDAIGVLSGGSNCASYESGNSGCGMVDKDTSHYGAGYNNQGGGVYAMKWDDSGISVYFFGRNEIPADIANGAPQPSGWHKPVANYKAASCNPWQFFKDHFAIFDTTLCGDWAGSSGSWSSSGCAASTGYGSCEQYVRENGAAFNDAYWEVKYVKLFDYKG